MLRSQARSVKVIVYNLYHIPAEQVEEHRSVVTLLEKVKTLPKRLIGAPTTIEIRAKTAPLLVLTDWVANETYWLIGSENGQGDSTSQQFAIRIPGCWRTFRETDDLSLEGRAIRILELAY